MHELLFRTTIWNGAVMHCFREHPLLSGKSMICIATKKWGGEENLKEEESCIIVHSSHRRLGGCKLTLWWQEGMAGRKQELTLVPHRQALAFCPTHQSPTRVVTIMLTLILVSLEPPTPSKPFCNSIFGGHISCLSQSSTVADHQNIYG